MVFIWVLQRKDDEPFSIYRKVKRQADFSKLKKKLVLKISFSIVVVA